MFLVFALAHANLGDVFEKVQILHRRSCAYLFFEFSWRSPWVGLHNPVQTHNIFYFFNNTQYTTITISRPCFFICRRFIWNFFRLENEHLNNCGEFRAVRDISVMPMDPNDHILLETLMDDETGPPRSSSVLVNGKLTHKRRSTIISNSTLANHTSV